jgi:hypothetical protein
VGLSLVVAGLGGSRSEKRVVGLSGKGGWPHSQVVVVERKEKKKIPTSWLSAGGFRWWLLRKQKKKNSTPNPFRASAKNEESRERRDLGLLQQKTKSTERRESTE